MSWDVDLFSWAPPPEPEAKPEVRASAGPPEAKPDVERKVDGKAERPRTMMGILLDTAVTTTVSTKRSVKMPMLCDDCIDEAMRAYAG